MFSKSSSRFLSLMLALVMLVSLCPTAFAAEVGTEPPVITETTELPAAEPTPTPTPTPTPEVPAPAPEPSQAPEVTPAPEPSQAPEVTPAPEPSQAPEVTPSPDPSQEPEVTPAPDPSQEPEVSPSPDPAEETEAPENPDAEETEETDPDAEEAEEEDEEAEEEETIELPYGFVGMPEGYELSQAELAAKAALSSYDTVNTLAALTPGVDYAANEVIFTCEDAEYAQLVAEAYSAVLLNCSYGVATIQLLTATVLEAVTAAADMTLPLPAVEPNYITRVAPLPGGSGALVGDISTMAIGERQSWETWIHENLYNPDPYIKDPTSSNYQWMHAAVNSYEAWGVSTGSGITVAVIDSGVNAGHADFGGRVVEVDVGMGTGDPDGHGTHVAGIIGATLGNGLGGSGIAPAVCIRSYRTANSSGGLNSAAIVRAINAAVSDHVNIINMSLGGPFPSPAQASAVQNAIKNGITVIAAMGNDGTNAVKYPAAYPDVIAVISTDKGGVRSSFSTYGPWATVSAPGSNIISTASNGGYVSLSGTSMASPVVAGVAALYMSAVGYVSPQTMANVLKASAAKNGGVVDAAAMFDKVVNAPSAMVNGSTLPSSCTVSREKLLELETTSINDNGETIIYTLDGKTPSVKNGQVVNGTVYTGPISLRDYAGKTLTLKAAAVTGMGKISKIASYKIKVEELTADEVSVSITAPEVLVSGKSVQLTAELSPVDKVSQKVTYTIVESYPTACKLSSSGLLTAPKVDYGWVVVRATSVDYPSKFAEVTIQIEGLEPVAKINLSMTKLSLYDGQTCFVNIDSVEGAKGTYVDKNKVDFQWTSSNKKVATVDEYGNIEALAKGSATITCKALDGSNKTAKVSVTVLQHVQSITLTGQYSIAPGAKASYKATVLPNNASSKKLIWELRNAPAGVTISSSGTVSVSPSVPIGSWFFVVASSTDDYVSSLYRVEVLPKCTGIALYAADNYSFDQTGGNVIQRLIYKNGLSAANLYTVKPFADAGDHYTTLDLDPYAYGNDGCAFTWKSSNPKVATVDENGVITAVSKGSATITCTALDGSNKKASIKVTTLVPVSTMSIKTNAPSSIYGHYLGSGKSAKNTVIFGDTYGVPTNKKVVWSYSLLELNSDGTLKANRTSYAINNKLISLSSSGSVSVSKKLQKARNSSSEYLLIVNAQSTDGTGISASIQYYLIPLTETMILYPDHKKIPIEVEYYIDDETGKKVYYYDNVGLGAALFYCDQRNYLKANMSAFTYSSSNPQVASIVGVERVENQDEYYWAIFSALKKGTAKITVKTTDGSNKSISFTVVVTEKQIPKP